MRSGTATGPRLSGRERRVTLWLSAVMAVRMLGLFMMLPVLALFAAELPGSTPALVGLAVGVYGLTQALFQVPLGMLSDRLGRRSVIVAGLSVFAAGSVVAASADSMIGLIAGRAMQGAGAISAVVLALVSDVTRPEVRTRGMALVGMSIGGAFVIAVAVGPAIGGVVGTPGLFWTAAALAGIAILVVLLAIPGGEPTPVGQAREGGLGALAGILNDGGLLRLNLGILVLHAILAATFVGVPFLVQQAAGLDAGRHWRLYLPVMVVSAAIMLPLVRGADRRRGGVIFFASICCLAAAEGWIAVAPQGLLGLAAALALFFTGFNVLEAMLPAMVSRRAPPNLRGAALGTYSSCQFLGAFLGGIAGGWMHGAAGPRAVAALASVAAVAWAAVAWWTRRTDNRPAEQGSPPESEGRRRRDATRGCVAPGSTESSSDPVTVVTR